jgi:hypothetical protein
MGKIRQDGHDNPKEILRSGNVSKVQKQSNYRIQNDGLRMTKTKA